MAEHSNNPHVELVTSRGKIVIELYPEKAPKTVENFISYVKDGFYDGTIFHRVIDGFMAQGGGFTPDMEQKTPKSPIQNEADNGLKNDLGTIAMARTNDPHSATGQFFLNLKNNDFLNHTGKNPSGWGYAVFGQIVEGLDVLQQMGKVATGRSGMHQDVPKDTILIEKASLTQSEVAQ